MAEDQSDDEFSEFELQELIERGDVGALKQLQEQDNEAFLQGLSEPDDMGNTPLHTAVIHPSEGMLRYLWGFGHENLCIDMPCNGVPLLHLCLRMCAFEEHRSMMHEFLGIICENDQFMDDNRVLEKDDMGNTVFHLAAVVDSPEAASLFEKKAKETVPVNALLEAKNKAGNRVLHVAAKYKSAKMVTYLLSIHADVNALNSFGQTAFHMAAANRDIDTLNALNASWKELKVKDGLGRTPLEIYQTLQAPTNAKSTFLYHPDAMEHLPLAGHKRGGTEPPPENYERMTTLVTPGIGILRTNPFKNVVWEHELPVADIADVLRVHEVHYVEKLKTMCAKIPHHTELTKQQIEEYAQFCIDPDTALSQQSYQAAIRAAGVVCAAVDKVVLGSTRNAFCVVRPPGHHAGPVGKVTCAHDPVGSQGFCLLNNVVIGAAYARSHFKHRGINRIAILDFDAHHGNGSEECLKQLTPRTKLFNFDTPYGSSSQTVHQYKPWRNDQDIDNVFFCSVHGYGRKDPKKELDPSFQKAWFYPGSGRTNVPGIELSDDDDLEDDTEDKEFPYLWNIGIKYQKGQHARQEWRRILRTRVLPKLLEFKPDLIFLSAGFDGHKSELVNWGYLGLFEHDYEWLTQAVVKVANATCQGRVISVLEGGYNFHGRIASSFARSVAAHARALVNGAESTEEWTLEQMEYETKCEADMIVEAAQKKARAAFRSSLVEEESNRSKRQRKEVDYIALAAQLAKEE
ncbi:histone deacetylase [Thraustotheca clavata]|uniref:Histone deacetylase n=1 Tax=Thraustotheca clavata TaxID=74557 RepID=A0A1V9YVF7_9STRA|nr:histone deacetylase [Thraustotheca clavata]